MPRVRLYSLDGRVQEIFVEGQPYDVRLPKKQKWSVLDADPYDIIECSLPIETYKWFRVGPDGVAEYREERTAIDRERQEREDRKAIRDAETEALRHLFKALDIQVHDDWSKTRCRRNAPKGS